MKGNGTQPHVAPEPPDYSDVNELTTYNREARERAAVFAEVFPDRAGATHAEQLEMLRALARGFNAQAERLERLRAFIKAEL